MEKVISFTPHINASTKVLILGSMPGVKSLLEQQYYARPMNQFWRIVYKIFDAPLENDYEQRISFLLSKGIGLWDVLESCVRIGSLDSEIREEKANDFRSVFLKYPGIKHVCFNGAKAYNSFKKAVGFERFDLITYFKLPSTSPAHTKKFEGKIEDWSIIKKLLLET